MKKHFLWTLARVTAFSAALLLFPPRAGAQSDFDAEVHYVIDQGDTNSCRGLVTLHYNPGPEAAYLSIGALNTLNPNFFQIIVSNKLLAPALYSAVRQSVSIWFDLAALGVFSPNDMPVLMLYIHLLSVPGCYPFPPSSHADTKTVEIGILDYNAQGDRILLPVEEPPGAPPAPVACRPYEPVSEVYYRGCDVPNFDLDDSKHPDTASYAGDLNACVPTATANSLLWMDKEYGTFYGFPPEPHALLDTLSRYMKREANKGTFHRNFIRGKLDFINSRRLPLRVRFQSVKSLLDTNIVSSDGATYALCGNKGDYPDWEFLKQAVKEGCDVEINYRSYNAAKDVWYGHSVVVTGVEDYQKSGKKFLTFKHDTDQKKEGGTIQESDTVFVDDKGRLRYAGRKMAYIKDIVAECPAEPLRTSVERKGETPESPRLLGAYPNPFNSSVSVRVDMREGGRADLAVYDVTGREVAKLWEGLLVRGARRFTWNGEGLPGGVYLCRLRTEHGVSETIRLVLEK
ncbi:T9SS type A sorting domain-containing protein [bacterium]|nr:T9SS type A sorting domain-containing protein [bacterium]